MACSLVDLLRAMIQEAQNDIFQLRQIDQSATGRSRRAINDVLHAETLRLDMLRTALSEQD